jgi:hypothetical protein
MGRAVNARVVGAMLWAVAAQAGAQDLDWLKSTPEPVVMRAPSTAASLKFGASEQLKAWAVSPLAPIVAAVVSEGARQRLIAWDLREPDQAQEQPLPPDVEVTSLAFHPEQGELFLTARRGAQWQLLGQRFPGAKWAPTLLATLKYPLADVLVSPRRFSAAVEGQRAGYRIYFSVKSEAGAAVQTVREDGQGQYTLVGTPRMRQWLGESRYLRELDDTVRVYQGEGSARPVAIHPGGGELVLQDAKGCFQVLKHVFDDWQPEPQTQVMRPGLACTGVVDYLPNGLGWLHWADGVDGVNVGLPHQGARFFATEHRFTDRPRVTADGRGFVGPVAGGTGVELRYVPVALPLADVVNAAAFTAEPRAYAMFLQHEGLLKPGVMPQMYSLYDVERYVDPMADQPSLPYLITTDLFWELFAAAFESMFTVSEDQTAIPAFWRMVTQAQRHLDATPGADAALKSVFGTLAALRAGNLKHPEVQRIRAQQWAPSAFLRGPDGQPVALDFNSTMPRGFYTRSEAASTYFEAMRYLTMAPLSERSLAAISALPAPVQQAAQAWIASYRPFIAPSRAALAWQERTPRASYARRPKESPTVFPLSCGLDNEVFDRLTLHPELPADEQVRRQLPAGLDLALVMGSDLALQLQEPELRGVSNYREQVLRLRAYAQGKRDAPELKQGLYHGWLQALGVQWASKPSFPGSPKADGLWSAKRLQTGLASWATLRHATLLVNEQAGAQGGEGGPVFERLVQRPPRGYVEPDVATFKAIAGLFEQAAQAFDAIAVSWNTPSARGLRDGYKQRLIESRDLVLRFEAMARKQAAGRLLDDEEYALIMQVGGAIEHNFLVFKSAQSKRRSDTDPYGIAVPDPVPKVADVAMSGGARLLAAVGEPLEWQQVVPFFGRRQIVKGAAYGYYEFTSGSVMTDEAWRVQAPTQARPAWVRPYLLPSAGPARTMSTTGR